MTKNSTVTTREGTWVYCYDPETKQQSSVGKPVIAMPKETEASQVEHEEHVSLFPL
jgi:hypothetical protein